MKETISMKLLNVLQLGKEQLGKEALDRIRYFIGSQRTAEDTFMDRNGQADLYYTLFGWMLSYVMGMPVDRRKAVAYLESQDIHKMDLIHYAAYIRCRMIQQLMDGRVRFLLKYFLSSGAGIKELQEFSGLPNNDPQSPYTRFIWLSLQEDTGQVIKDGEEVRNALKAYQVARGGYSNIRDGNIPATNATVAALAVTGQLDGYRKNEDIAYLRDIQDESGGFGASEESPVPDLLSTATSLFLLNCYQVTPRYPSRGFIEAHWLDSGGFSATLMEETSDVEYTFYGLLALGAS